MSETTADTTARSWPARMRRQMASEYLREVHGVSLAPATLAKLAVVGGSPPFMKDGHFPLYPRDELDQFAIARLGPLLHTTKAETA